MCALSNRIRMPGGSALWLRAAEPELSQARIHGRAKSRLSPARDARPAARPNRPASTGARPLFSCYLQEARCRCRTWVLRKTGWSGVIAFLLFFPVIYRTRRADAATTCLAKPEDRYLARHCAWGCFAVFFPGAGFDPRVCGLRTMSGPTGTRFWQQICNKSTRRWRASRAVETCVPSIARAQAGLR